MNTSEFVKLWKEHAVSLYQDYTSGDGQTAVSKLLIELNLNDEAMAVTKKMIETILIDTHYSFLMGLDGCANIGGIQQDYRVLDEDGNAVFEAGELEAEAYEQFQENWPTTT